MNRQLKCDYCDKVFDGHQTRSCSWANSSYCSEASSRYFELQKLKLTKQNIHTHNVNKNVNIHKTKKKR